MRRAPVGSRALLGIRDFRLLLAAWGLSALGDFLTVVTLTLRVEEQTNFSMRVLLQSRVDEALRGRVYAAYQASLSIADFAALAVGGALIQLLGARWTLALAGGGCLLVGLYGLPVVRRRT